MNASLPIELVANKNIHFNQINEGNLVMIKLGYAQTDITPKIPMPLIGFNRTDNTSRGY